MSEKNKENEDDKTKNKLYENEEKNKSLLSALNELIKVGMIDS